ncbi:MAG TPA: DNA polymerase III subunit beta [Porphyromonadaceae bacterium]|nr:DNA polymerase III subunit beta [Porphyromonadaceae bacterium]
MKFEVSSMTLLSHLQQISKVIASKNSLPILDSFLFDLQGNTLSITASDAETRMVTSLEVNNVEGSGVFAVSAKILLDPLKELADQPLVFTIDDSNLEVFIYFQNGKYNFIGQRGDTYPEYKTLSEDAASFNIDAQMLLSGINRTFFATADDELRPVMNGVYFDLTPDDLTFVASDGHKLVKYRNMALQSGQRAAFILPKKPANLLKGILAKESSVVEVRFDDKNALFKVPNFEMTCRLIEGRYPNYNSVIPKENPHKVIVDRIMLLNALKRVSVFSSQSSNLVKFQVVTDQIIISAQDVDFSTAAEERISCQYGDVSLSIGFKASYLIEILNNINATEVVLELADPSRAGLIVPMVNEADEELVMLLMPMMLND